MCPMAYRPDLDSLPRRRLDEEVHEPKLRHYLRTRRFARCRRRHDRLHSHIGHSNTDRAHMYEGHGYKQLAKLTRYSTSSTQGCPSHSLHNGRWLSHSPSIIFHAPRPLSFTYEVHTRYRRERPSTTRAVPPRSSRQLQQVRVSKSI